jgi:anti-sigma B factor antagonist
MSQELPPDTTTPPPPVHSVERMRDGVPDGTALIVLGGELDLSSADEFREAVEAATDEGADRIVLDLAEVAFVDSSMLKELLRANSELGDGGRTLVLAAPRPPVTRLLELTRTAELFTLAPDRAAALG